jgi:hypothetical protein
MSLINDALKRASQTQQNRPPASAPGPQLRPVEPSRRPPDRGPGLMFPAAIVVVVVVLVSIIGWLWMHQEKPPRKIVQSEQSQLPAAAPDSKKGPQKTGQPQPVAVAASKASKLQVAVTPAPVSQPAAPPAKKPAEPKPLAPAKAAQAKPVAPARNQNTAAASTPVAAKSAPAPAPVAPAPVAPAPVAPAPAPVAKTSAVTPAPVAPAPVAPAPTAPAQVTPEQVAPTPVTPEPVAAAPAAATPAPKTNLKLQAIFYHPKDPAATSVIISGRSVFIGESVGEFRVTAIGQDSATLVNAANQTVVLSLPLR